MSRLVIVSNRLPISVTRHSGSIRFQPSVDGLATGLRSFCKSHKSQWIGWPGIATDRISVHEKQQIRSKLKEDNCQPVFLTTADVKNFYHGFCNKTIWPLFHYFSLYTAYEDQYWKAYKQVNNIFCENVLKIVKPDDYI